MEMTGDMGDDGRWEMMGLNQTFVLDIGSYQKPNPVFKDTAFLKSNMSKTVHFMDKVTREH